MAFQEKHLQELVQVAIKHKASDIHLRAGETPCFRILGKLTPIQTKSFSDEDMENVGKILLKNRLRPDQFEALTEEDGSYEVEGLFRLRFNVLRYQGKLGAILRIINVEIPEFSSLNLPDAVKKIALQPRGMILVTGITGSGKSTTLASMINHINENKRVHVLTLEDPIEYLHPQKKARITQREIGTDTPGFIPALRAALRQDPDVISIGEMRDAETMSIALKAAETGHLVLSTVHTTDALSTIGRLIGMVPPEEQDNVRKRLAENLYATVSQRLIPKSGSKEMVPALEIMINSPGIRDCILGKEDLSTIYTYIKKGYKTIGSQAFDQHLQYLLKNGIIDQKTAEGAAASGEDFARSLIFE